MGMFDEIFKAIQNNPGSFAQAGLGGFNAYQQNQANEEANRKNRRNVGRANAINAFGGNAIAQREAPELSGLGKFGQVAQGGLQAFQGAQAMNQQRDLRDQQLESSQAAGKLSQFNLDTRAGTQAANALGVSPSNVPVGYQPPEGLSEAGVRAFNAQQRVLAKEDKARIRAEEDRQRGITRGDTADQQALDEIARLKNQDTALAEYRKIPTPTTPAALRPSAIAIGESLPPNLNDEQLDEVVDSKLGEFAPPGTQNFIALRNDAIASYHSTQDAIADKINEQFRGILDKSGEIAKDTTAEAGFQYFQSSLALDKIVMTPEMATQAMKAITASQGGMELSAPQTRLFAGIVSLQSSLADIESKIGSPKFRGEFNALGGRVTELVNVVDKEYLDPELVGLMTDIGFTAEMAVRIFSGAAVRDEEFERFRDDFIAALSAGPDQALEQIGSFREGLYRQQMGLAVGVAAQRSGNLLIGIPDELLMREVANPESPVGDQALAMARERGIYPKEIEIEEEEEEEEERNPILNAIGNGTITGLPFNQPTFPKFNTPQSNMPYNPSNMAPALPDSFQGDPRMGTKMGAIDVPPYLANNPEFGRILEELIASGIDPTEAMRKAIAAMSDPITRYN